MIRTIGNLALLTAGLCASVGCFHQTRPATLVQLQRRAVFDLGCPNDQLLLYHLDNTTKAVAGCGRRLVYVESCGASSASNCSWRLDTPTFAQVQWPQNYSSRPVLQVIPAPAAAPPPPPHGYPKELFSPGEQPPRSSSPSRPSYSTDLYGSGAAPVPPRFRLPTDSAQPASAPLPAPSQPYSRDLFDNR